VLAAAPIPADQLEALGEALGVPWIDLVLTKEPSSGDTAS
jgi:hypothetical protein